MGLLGSSLARAASAEHAFQSFDSSSVFNALDRRFAVACIDETSALFRDKDQPLFHACHGSMSAIDSALKAPVSSLPTLCEGALCSLACSIGARPSLALTLTSCLMTEAHSLLRCAWQASCKKQSLWP